MPRGDEDVANSGVSTGTHDLLHNQKWCGKCGGAGSLYKCECKQIFYCGQNCQRGHWNTHKNECSFALSDKVRRAEKEWGKRDIAVAKAEVEVGQVAPPSAISPTSTQNLKRPKP